MEMDTNYEYSINICLGTSLWAVSFGVIQKLEEMFPDAFWLLRITNRWLQAWLFLAASVTCYQSGSFGSCMSHGVDVRELPGGGGVEWCFSPYRHMRARAPAQTHRHTHTCTPIQARTPMVEQPFWNMSLPGHATVHWSWVNMPSHDPGLLLGLEWNSVAALSILMVTDVCLRRDQ